ncbi:MAG: CaiB/BaiF CoA transferase family protein [Acidimicrobiales bacterium]
MTVGEGQGGSASSAPRPGPLTGTRVVECGSLIAGPFCGHLLGDVGAEVIKVEDPTSGDPMRQWGQKVDGLSLHWPIVARNKKSITADLRREEGQELLRDLVARSDILLENFRPGTLERWGLSFAELSAVNPGLVLVRVSGYGQTGPYAPRAGFGSVGEAMGGIRYLTGEPDRPAARSGISLGDSLAATFAAFGAVMALHARHRTGRGQIVDSAIYEAVLALMESVLPEWELAHYQRERTGAVLPGVAPSNAYPTADGDEVLIGGNRDTVFVRLAEAMGRPELATDARYATHQARGERQAELDRLVASWTGSMDTEPLLAVLADAGVPAGRIFQTRDMLGDPHFAAREAVLRLTHKTLGEFPMQAVAPRLSDTPGGVQSLGPELGEHNEEIYRGLLGLEAAQLDDLRARGIV